jgi:hypothetical protein
VPGKVAGIGGRGARAISKAARISEDFAGSTSDLFSSLAKVGEALETPTQIPIGLYNAIVMDKKLYAPLRAAAKKGGLALSDEIGKSTKLTDALIDSNRLSSLEAANAGDRYVVLGAIAKGPDDLFTYPAYRGLVNRLEEIAPDIVAPMKSGQVNPKKLAQKVLSEARKSSSTFARDSAKIVDTTLPEKLGIGQVSFYEDKVIDILESSRSAVRTSLQSTLSNSILGEWTFLTPNIVVSTKAAKSASPVRGKNMVQYVADNVATNMRNYVDVVEVGQEATFKLNQPINVKNLLKQSLVYSPGERLAYYEKLFKGLSVGDTMSPEQYKALHTLVSEASIGTLEATQKLGAFKPGTAGRAYKSASEPEVLRSSIIQYGKQLSEEGQKAIDKIAKTTFYKAPISKEVANITNGYAGALESLPGQFAQTISTFGKQGLKTKEIYGHVLNKSVNEKLGVATVEVTSSAMENEKAIELLEDVMFSQFKLAKDTPKSNAIKKIIQEEGRELSLNPQTNASEFYKNAVAVRQAIVRKYPEILDQEVITQLKGARFRKSDLLPNLIRVDSLPDTILSIASGETQRKLLQDIISKNRNILYDDFALINIEKMSQQLGQARSAARDIPFVPYKLDKEIVKNLIDSALVAKLDGASPDDILKVIRDTYAEALRGKPGADDMFSVKAAGFEEFGGSEQIVNAVNNYYIDVIRATHGLESASGSEILRRLDIKLQEISDGVLAYVPAELSGDIKVIKANLEAAGKDPLRTERLISTIDELERQSPGFFARLAGDLGSLGGYIHKNIAEGMLAGKVIPNVTYLSENVFTAPLIAAVTNPKYIDTVLKNVPKMAGKTTAGLVGGEFGKFGGYTSDLYQPALSYPNKVAIVTPSGEQITNAELWRLFTEARVGAGQAETVLRPQSIAQLKQLSQLVGTDSKLMTAAGRRFNDFLPSSTASVPMTVAQNTDMAFRQALFKEALERGATAEEAATIARETLLDYGLLDRILPDQLKAIKAPFMFLSFSTSMSAAILKGVTRGETAENILRMARYHNDMAKYSGVYAPGQAELESLFVQQQKTIGEKPATYAYLRDPIFGQIFWAANIAENLSYFISGGESLGGMFENLMNETAYTPYTGFILDIVDAYKGSMVSPRQIAFAQASGLWPSMQSNFEIEEIPIEKMRRGEPTFQGKQYRFKTEAGKKKYITFMFGLTMAGHNRTLNDYTNMMIAAGMAPEGAYLARYYPENPQFEGIQADPSLKGFVNGALYMIARQRAIKPPTEIQVYDKQIQTALRKLKDLQGTNVEN